MMKNLLTLLLCIGFYAVKAQQFDQLITDTIDYQSNPAYTKSELAYYPNHIVSTKLESKTIIYGQDIYGIEKIRVHDNLGNLVYNFTLGKSACVKWIEATPGGKVYVAGTFMDTLNLNGLDTLIVNSPSLFNVNAFLLCIAPNGTLSWKRNLTLQHTNMQTIDMLTLDPAGNCWYSYCDWQAGYIYGTNTNGQDITNRVLSGGIRSISGLSFDPSGNLYISGAVENGTINIGSFSKVVTNLYNMYITRFNSSGQASWFISIRDITFQNPRIQANSSGEAFFSGLLLDSASMGSFSLPDPQFGWGLILAKIDSSGNTLWLKGNPIMPTITGSFRVGTGHNVAADDQGGCVLTGQTTGLVDWGNNVVSGQPTIGSLYTHTVLAWDQNGIAQWSLDATGSYANPSSVILTSNTSGYTSGIVRGSIPYGPFQISQPWQYTLSNAVVRFNFGPTGLSEESKDMNRSFYPNPTSGNVNFKQPLEAGMIELIDLNGRVVKKLFIPSGTSTLELNLKPGYYLMNYRYRNSYSRMPVVITD
jgi:hypothetical protein